MRPELSELGPICWLINHGWAAATDGAFVSNPGPVLGAIAGLEYARSGSWVGAHNTTNNRMDCCLALPVS